MQKILVIDDDKNLVMLLQDVLQMEGYEVCVAYDGREGLLKARSEKPDLIVLDVMMPEMDGITVSGMLFQDPLMRLTPVLILTAKGTTRNLLELVPNVRLYMTKPFDPQEVLQNVKRLLVPQAKTA